jgi:hypothetical protein
MTLRYPMCPLPRDASRRDFLSHAAAVAAGGVVLAASASTASANAAPVAAAYAASQGSSEADSIFAAIEAHKAASVAFARCISIHSKLEAALPKDRRRSNIDAHEHKIVEADDPRWIESERSIDALGDVESDTACALVNVRPSTMAGVLALLNYAITADRDGETWGVDLQDDDGRSRSWHHFLIVMLADVLPDVLRAGATAGMVRT